MQDLITIDFYGDSILALETEDGSHYVAVLPICERLGVSRQGQQQKINAAPERWGGKVFLLPSAGGEQETLCLPMSKIAGWLLTIHANKVNPEVRDTLLRYQNEADAVLDRHFRLRAKELSAELEEAWELHRRAKCFALANSARMNRIARLQEAGVSYLDMPAVLGISMNAFEEIEGAMTDAGLLEGGWDKRRLTPAEIWKLRRAPREVPRAGDAADLFAEG
ncbi:phage antirepressor N-terminal domain-containing protein [Rhodoblastus sp.]|uniref:phage antirepressor N-terminal domain-containing protein n=1 Tax=Rhodoblastus sp. TaxID=1962975 RepID=UPI003F94F5F9